MLPVNRSIFTELLRTEGLTIAGAFSVWLIFLTPAACSLMRLSFSKARSSRVAKGDGPGGGPGVLRKCDALRGQPAVIEGRRVMQKSNADALVQQGVNRIEALAGSGVAIVQDAAILP